MKILLPPNSDLVDLNPNIRTGTLLEESNLIDPRILAFFNKIINFLFWFFLVLLLFMILYFALKYISGKKENIEEVHSRIKPVLFAVILVFFAFTIPVIIKSFFETFFR